MKRQNRNVSAPIWAASIILILVSLHLDTKPARAQLNDFPVTTQTAAKPCATRSESRQFDFWIGDWEVRTPQGQLAGTNNVQLILGDCVIAENWTGARGSSGKSFNFYDAGTGKWHQLWVDDRGGVLRLTGEYRDGAMRFEGETPGRDGTKTLEKLTFTPLPEGRVRQYWEQSGDDGKTWKVIVDGPYIRKKSTPALVPVVS
jgi:hypothetical protein